MGQCSTLPTEARNQEQSQYMPSPQGDYRREEGSNPASDRSRPRGRYRRGNSSNSILHVTVPQNEEKRRPPPPQPAEPEPQPYQSRETPSSVEPMQEDDPRDAAPVLAHDIAKRTRCYKLNLDSELVGLSGDIRVEGNLLGPYSEPPPPLTYSHSDDSTAHTDPTMIAIQTAQIFRGIKVARDGTILSQNARATRSNRGTNKPKRGEKSRQAAKIDKAKDLVEESLITGKAPGTNDPANLVSLYIMGEYDEMKYLVRDGSKKLRDHSTLPDDALLSINRLRTNSFLTSGSGLLNSSSRKRVSPSGGSVPDPLSSPRLPSMPQSAPPKLKGHPRDTRRDENRRRGFLPVQESCFGGSPQMGGSDWGEALGFNSIWNCGSANASGTASPVMTTKEKEYHNSPTAQRHQQQQRVYEGRNETSYSGRHDPSNRSTRA